MPALGRCFLAVPLLCSVLCAQVTGRLTGSVTDPSGAAVPQATVSLFLHGGKRAVTSTRTGPEGLFTLEAVRSEFYDLTIDAKGFQPFKVENIKVDPARTTDLIALKLDLAATSTSVEVQSGAEAVQTTSPEISSVVTMNQVRRLPVADRNPLDFIATQAGVASTQFATVINGQRESFSTMTLDGVSIQDNYLRDNALDFAPNQLLLDQVQEFTVSTSLSSSAASGSSQVNFITPSGTNQFHGAAYWQNRNNKFAANDFFNNKDGIGLPRLNLNNGGVALGGPIKHDRIFFYSNYEGTRSRNETREDATILTASARGGIFKYIDSSGAVQQANILQLAGQQINPVIAALLNDVPGPEKINNFDVGDSHPGQLLNTAGYAHLVRNNQDRDNLLGKLDVVLSEKHSLAGTFAYNRNLLDRPDFAASYAAIPAFQNDDHVKFGALSWRWSPTPTLTNELRGGFNYAPGDFISSVAPPSSIIGGLAFSTPVAAAGGLPQGRNTRTRNLQEKATWIKGRHTFEAGYQYQGVRVHSYDDSGTVPVYDVSDPGCSCVDSSKQQGSLLNAAALPGISSFDLTNANVMLASLAGLLNDDSAVYNIASRTSGFVPGVPWERNFTYDNHAFFAQDRWKIAKSLTLTLGLRWDYYTPVSEANSLELQTVVTNNNPIGSLLSPDGTLDFTGNSVGKPFYHKDLNNWAPNAGFAWDVFGNGKTAIRGGYAIHYVDDQMVEVADGFTYYNPGLQAYQVNYDLEGKVSSLPPIPPPPYQVPTGFAQQFQYNPGLAVTLMDPHLRTPYDQQFAFSIQHEYRGTIFEVRYVGSHATKLLRGFNVNQEDIRSNGFLGDFLKAQQNGALALAATGVYNPAYNPRLQGSQPLLVFRQLSDQGDLSDQTYRSLIQNGEAAELAYQYTINGERGSLNFFPNPNALDAIYLTNYSNSEYNSAQVDVRRRFQHGLEFQANYVFSKWLTDASGLDQLRMEPFLDINNPGLDRARSPNDVTHQFKANYSYDLPLHGSRKWDKLLLGGWTTSGNLSWSSGNPFSINSSLGTFLREDNSGYNEANTPLTKSQLDDVLQLRMTGNGPYIVPASAIGPDGRGVAPAGQAPFAGQLFTNPAAGMVGTLQRRMFTGPSVFAMDAAVFKTTKIREKVAVELRLEALNVFNHAAFAVFSTNTDINLQQFGQVTQAAILPRQLQLGLRVQF